MSVSDSGKYPKSSFEIYRAEGDSLLKNSEFIKAISCFTNALEQKPNDQHCLVSRSKCYLQEGEIEKALADAEESLKDDPTCHKGLLQKAEVLYFCGDFENALVFYHRGNNLRPEMQDFRLGIQKAEEAINNSVGEPDTIQLKSDGDLTYFYQQEEEEKAKKKKTTSRPSYQKPKKEDTGPKRAQRKQTQSDNKTVKKLLGELYADREYLEKLLSTEESCSRKTENSEKIRELCVEGLNYLDSRSEFWQQQKPMYARGRGSCEKEKGDRLSESGKQNPARYVLNNLEQIDEKQARGDYNLALKQAKRVLKQVETWTEDYLTNKHEVLANLHSLIGNCLLDMGKYDRALYHHEKDLEIGKSHNIDECVSRASDNVGRVYARTGQFAKAIQVWEEKVHSAKSELEKTWLFHEIGRCYLEKGDAKSAFKYGELALQAARETNDDNWQLNSTVLIAQAEVRLEHYKDAIGNFEHALDIARLLNNNQAEDAIVRAIDDVNGKVVELERESLRKEKIADKVAEESNLEIVANGVEESEINSEEKQEPATTDTVVDEEPQGEEPQVDEAE